MRQYDYEAKLEKVAEELGMSGLCMAGPNETHLYCEDQAGNQHAFDFATPEDIVLREEPEYNWDLERQEIGRPYHDYFDCLPDPMQEGDDDEDNGPDAA